MFISELTKEHEWELITSAYKETGVMSVFDDDFECPECGDIVDFNDFMDGSEPYGCPSCGEQLL